jgi:ubiquinone/menaquinone biosynthesis C-methylase UbiE
MGWSPRRRIKYGYTSPGDYYEAIVNKLVRPESIWVDIGGGKSIFPHNQALSRQLSQRCKKLVAVDPSNNVLENDYAHEKYVSLFEDWVTKEDFSLATFRMVAEHITNPDAVLSNLQKIISRDGLIVIYTINKFSPVSIFTYLTPNSWHYSVKRLFFGGKKSDTFPVAYRMNSRKVLKSLFESHGFNEEHFLYLDDLALFSGFKTLNLFELWLWQICKKVGINYPENNLLGVYRRV